MDTIQDQSPNRAIVVTKETKRLVLKSEEARRDLLIKLQLLNVPVTKGAANLSRGEFVINLQWPNEPLQLEIINPTVQKFPHEIAVDDPNA
jgi:hypothetical protein